MSSLGRAVWIGCLLSLSSIPANAVAADDEARVSGSVTTASFEGTRPSYLGANERGANERPRTLRDAYCGAYVVWHILDLTGQRQGIEGIIGDLNVTPSEGVRVRTIVGYLAKQGIEARPGRIDPMDIRSIPGEPFIIVLPATEGFGEFGHAALCTPTQQGQWIVYDQADKPYVLESDRLGPAATHWGWSGDVILLGDDSRSEWGYVAAAGGLSLMLTGIVVNKPQRAASRGSVNVERSRS